ncbi:MAG: GyrI-like domain-containing protein [Deltaproteobacteria bacterium]|nr:GyrI-like domain-containing protein [Deltaproteobacteria bacterium]
MANEKLDLMKLHKADYAATGSPRILDVAPARYLAVVGQGAPGGEEFGRKVGALYAVAFTTKMARKAEGRDYGVGKLEGLWWCDEAPGWEFAHAPRDLWQWKLLIRTPDFVTDVDVATAAKALAARGKTEPVGGVRLETLAEGTCVQVLHTGPYDAETDTIRGMHAFAEAEGYAFHGRHHEIYVNDPSRTAPEKLRTILRHPVCPRPG